MQPVSAGAQPQELAYRIIPLSKGKFAKVSPEDFERVSQYKWYATQQKGRKQWRAYAVFSSGGKTVNLAMHRFILGITDSKIQADHRDHDSLNNTRENLRSCNGYQNQANRVTQKNNTSGYKGVSWDKVHHKWIVMIQHQNKQYNLGRYDDKKYAYSVYVAKAKELFGEFFHP
jgi:hypothetical protein